MNRSRQAAEIMRELRAFEAALGRALGELPAPEPLLALLALDAEAPLSRDEQVRTDVRDMLRQGGYKPTGRGKPASEYLVKAAAASKLTPINLVVDACNAVSLHSGLPISVVDFDRLVPPLRVEIAGSDARYVFNASGQEIKLAGLLCLHDAEGPCANAVRDSQRTKTHAGTTRALCIIWGCKQHTDRVETAARWYRDLLESAGCETHEHPLR